MYNFLANLNSLDVANVLSDTLNYAKHSYSLSFFNVVLVLH
jgi:hypothetical protein